METLENINLSMKNYICKIYTIKDDLSIKSKQLNSFEQLHIDAFVMKLSRNYKICLPKLLKIIQGRKS